MSDYSLLYSSLGGLGVGVLIYALTVWSVSKTSSNKMLALWVFEHHIISKNKDNGKYYVKYYMAGIRWVIDKKGCILYCILPESDVWFNSWEEANTFTNDFCNTLYAMEDKK